MNCYPSILTCGTEGPLPSGWSFCIPLEQYACHAMPDTLDVIYVPV